MCTGFFNPLSANVSGYHVHIYYEAAREEQAALACELTNRILSTFPDKASGGYRIGRVGPHPMENIEVDITTTAFGEVVSFIQMNSQGLSILIHPHTGDEIFDHLQAGMWLGQQLPLNRAFLDKFQKSRVRAVEDEIARHLKDQSPKS